MPQETADRRLAPAAGLEVVARPDDLVLATGTGVLRLDGGVARAVQERLLPQLALHPTRAELLTALADLPGADVSRLVDRLVAAGMLTEMGEPPAPDWLTLVSAEAEVRSGLAEQLRAVRLSLLGADRATAGIAAAATAAGVDAVRRFDVEGLDRPAVEALVAGNDLVVTIVDPGLVAVRSWVNTAALAADVASLHVALDGTRAEVGPLVLPGEGPCYLCWRMRALACADDFELAMAREEALDAGRRPIGRPLLPGLADAAGTLVVRELLALTTSLAQPSLAGWLVVIEGLALSQARHRVLPRPDCPACAKKGRRPVADPFPAEGAEAGRTTDFDLIAEAVTSGVCGLVRNLDLMPKLLEEPRQPLVVRAELANVTFATGDDAFVSCSGKGLDLTSARNSALGEALERYASLTWTSPRTLAAARADLPGASLDPRDLVLFAPEQYRRLPFVPYTDDLVLDWVPARSLVTDAPVWVPQLAATLRAPHRRPLLFQPTSNGFAAGPDVAFAAERALLEVVERDAFLIAWAHRLPTTPYAAGTVPDEAVRTIAALYERRGVRIDVHLLPTDHAATVAMAVGWSQEAPAAVVGLGADLDPVAAARGAVLEVGQVRPALRARLRDPEVSVRLAELVADPAQVAELEDHDLLYADPATAGRALAHLRTAVQPWPSPPARAGGLPELVASLAAVAGDVLCVDVTPADVAALGVRVVRGIVPGFQPIHFGADQARLGGTRLFRLGQELNPDPHPLA